MTDDAAGYAAASSRALPPPAGCRRADAVIRLRAECLFSQNFNKIHFHLTTGYDAWFSDYVAGRTFRVQGEQVLPAAKATKTPTQPALGAWFAVPEPTEPFVEMPEWTFARAKLGRFE